MKTERKIRLLTDETIDPPGTELCGEEAQIDALLRSVADECSAKVDFEGIKQRAIAAAEAKKARRRRIRRAVGAGLAAAASFMFAFFLISALRTAKPDNKGNQMAMNTDVPKKDPASITETSTTKNGYAHTLEAGALPEADYQVILDSVTELFPDELPATMRRLSDNAAEKIVASGVDSKGGEIGYVCSIEDGASKGLSVGEAGSIEEDDDISYYWQITDGNYLKIQFIGFSEEAADRMFKSLASRITDNSSSKNK
ncbi:MAG: hypothetical protein IK064_02080 [Clostridia bacterium]|nr:hypothetical protein [Clostridia bacterium]MBR6006397.1 hypothetical protein [Clostridia bacterium]